MKILVVEDINLNRETLCIRLRAEKELNAVIVGEACDGLEAVELARKHLPDLILMDIQMPRLNGIEATRRILQDNPDCRILALSMYAKDMPVIEALRAGALGFVDKSCDFAELTQAIQSIMAGRFYLSKEVTPVVREYLMNSTSHSDAYSFLALNEDELTIIRLTVEGKSLKEIAYFLKISENNATKKRLEIMRKLRVENVAELVNYAKQELFLPQTTTSLIDPS